MNPKENVEIAYRIFRDYGATLRSMVERYGISGEDVDDIYQNIFLSIVRHPPSHGTSLGAYLKTVVRNHVRDYYRRMTSRHNIATKYAEFLKIICTENVHKNEFVQVDLFRKTMKLLKDALPPYMTYVIIERYIRGKNVNEIASKLGIRKRSVSRYCCVGIKRLRHLLDD